MRNPTRDEDPPATSYVDFEFSLDKSEQESLLQGPLANLVCQTDPRANVIKVGSKRMSLPDIISDRAKCYYRVDIPTGERTWNSFSAPGKWSLLGQIKKVAAGIEADTVVSVNDTTIPLAEFSFIDTKGVRDAPTEAIQDTDLTDLLSHINTAVKDFAEGAKPNALLWTYDDRNLLPPAIARDQFASRPRSCVPLFNMFKFAGISDISTAISEAEEVSRSRLVNLLSSVAEKTTRHFSRVWPEYKGISFSLLPDGDNIICGIQDSTNLYDLSDRSDGFKRFATFLLLISLQTTREALSDTVILIDEPEISLHPPSAEALRDELLRMANSNTVVFSTHSPFMVDRNNIPRHYIVSKSKEQTVIEIADQAQVKGEEVLYHALGWSIFNALEARNLVFEGWRDKRLFDLALQKTSLDTDIKRRLATLGRCHARGAKDIKTLAGLLALGSRECIAISDNDRPAREQQTEFQRERRHGHWLTYQDVWPECHAVTGEDFIHQRVFLDAVTTAAGEHTVLGAFGTGDLPENEPRLHSLDTWMRRKSVSGHDRKAILGRVKSLVFDQVGPKDIEPTYLTFLERLDAHLHPQ